MLPFAEGALLNHNPVTKDDVTRIPKVMITYLLASVRAYILDQTRFRESGRRPGWVWITVSPHRQEYEAERQNEDEIISFQLYSVVTPGIPRSAFERLNVWNCWHVNLNSHLRAVKLGSRLEENGTYFLGITGQERRCKYISE